MFYTIYEHLCKECGEKPYSVASKLGLGNSNVAQWKKGSTPRGETLQKIAEYFNVSQAYLLGYEDKKSTAPMDGDGFHPTKEYWEDIVGKMSKEEMQTAMEILMKKYIEKDS